MQPYQLVSFELIVPVSCNVLTSDRSMKWSLIMTQSCLGLNPLDVTKIRMQNQVALPNQPLKYTGIIQGIRVIFREEGWRGLGKGLIPSMMREITYSSVRMGAYEPIRAAFAKLYDIDPKDIPAIEKFLSALLSG